MAPLLKFATSLGSKKKEPRYAYKKNPSTFPVREAPFVFPKRVSMERDAPSPEPSHLYLSESPFKKLSYEMREKHRSPSTEPHVEGRPTYNGVRPGSTRGLLPTLLSHPQCHAAFSTLPCTLAWVDQSPVSQRFVVTLNRIYPPQLLPPST
jgi:hypothetical protein